MEGKEWLLYYWFNNNWREFQRVQCAFLKLTPWFTMKFSLVNKGIKWFYDPMLVVWIMVNWILEFSFKSVISAHYVTIENY